MIDETQILFSSEENSNDSFIDTSTRTNSSTSSLGIYIRMILMLAIVLFIIYVLFRLIKANAVNVSEDSQFLRKVASLSISQGKSIQIITLVDSAFLIGVTDNSINLISKIEDKELINALNLYADKYSNKNKPRNFSDVLDIFMPNKKQAKPFSTGSAYNDGATSELLESIKNKSKRLEEEE